ncbi:acyl-CoA dehydrogenase family protein [Desulfomonile tiedjei]|uniref:Cyclohex-1-ene-1-carbonyl-CoA dehydrogenase n=1 Tax=Desulfomonile tiedjei (strain ATCC 49306 / DSM 6799 / DCB-1) TaxID=706587 RepID=I4C874_DESTA|nr:acyl-CoA dehydrogenase family protein [Desulfomonile tiedjei]AFM25765.1 acyl-CoA dehydrogenase [Desulfomonile tiedjei DSM 6799]
MDFKLNDEQRLIRKAARDFATKELAPNAREWEETATFSRQVFDKMGQLDFTGLYIPEKYDGTGVGRLTAALIFEELAKGCFATAVYLSVHNMVANLIFQYGNEEQRERWVKPLALGEKLGAYSLTEGEAGSDAANLQTTAVKTDGGYVVNGTKLYVTSGEVADVYAVMIRTDEAQKQRGISAFIVEKGTKGFGFGPHEPKMGLNASPTTELHFNDCFIPEENLIGEKGKGFNMALSALNGGRVSIGACSTGLAQQAFDYALAYAHKRHQFGRPIVSFQGLQFLFADLATEIEASRLLVYRAAAMMDQGEPCVLEAAMGKRFATDTAMRVTTEAVQILGGYGYMKSYPVEMYMRFAKVAQIFEGTNQIQRVVIARELGKYKGRKAPDTY